MTWHRPGVAPFTRPERDDDAREFLRDLRLIAGLARACGQRSIDAQRAWLEEDAARVRRLARIARSSQDDRAKLRAIEFLARLMDD